MKFFFLNLFVIPLFGSYSVSSNIESAVIVNCETGRILFEKKSHNKSFPASVTKIATALVALDYYKVKLDDIITIEPSILKTATMSDKKKNPQAYPSYTLEPDGTSINLIPYESISMKTLLYGLMLGSGNDAANAIAHHCAKNIPDFLKVMNEYVKKLGCKNTYFTNPHGLHDANHYTTAYDLSLMAQKALKIPFFSALVKTNSYVREETNKQKSFPIIQTNRLIKPGPYFYSKAYGIKTGYTSNAGYNLVTAATNGKRNLIMVLLGSKTSEPRYKEAVNLFEEAFNEIKTEQKLFAKGADIFKKECKGGIVPLKAILNEDIDLVYYPSEPLEIETKVNWFDKKLPIQIGDCVGVIEVLDKPSKSMVIRKELYAQNFVDYTLMYKISSSMDTLCGALFFHKYMILLGLGFFIMAYIMSRKSSSQKVK